MKFSVLKALWLKLKFGGKSIKHVVKMTESQIGFPHVYYSVSELIRVKDATVMRNKKIKSIGFIYKKERPVLKESADSSNGILLNLKHFNGDVLEIYPYIVFGVLHTANSEPVITVKWVKRFSSSWEDLEIYKNQCLTLRNRFPFFDSIAKLAEVHNWN